MSDEQGYPFPHPPPPTSRDLQPRFAKMGYPLLLLQTQAENRRTNLSQVYQTAATLSHSLYYQDGLAPDIPVAGNCGELHELPVIHALTGLELYFSSQTYRID